MSVLSEVASADHSSLTVPAAERPFLHSSQAIPMTAAQASAPLRAPAVVMLLANEFTHDTRVYKEARSLAEWGCDVHVVATTGPGLPIVQQAGERFGVSRLEVRASRLWRLCVAMLVWWCVPLLRLAVHPWPLPGAGPQENNGTSTKVSTSAENSRSKRVRSTAQRVAHVVGSPSGAGEGRARKKSIAYRAARLLAIYARRVYWRTQRLIRLCMVTLPGRAVRALMPGVPGLLGLNYDMARRAIALQPTVIQAHDLNTLLAGVLVKRLTGAKLVYDSHELFLERNIASKSRWRDKLVWSPIEKWCIGKCDAVLSVAEGICLHLAKKYRIAKPHLVRNVQPFEPPPQRTRLLSRELGIPDHVSIVIYPGAITINRGLEAMIDSAPHLENAAYVVMGYARNPKYLAQLKDRATRQGVLDSRVFFRDAVPIDDVVRYTASADLGIVPTQNVCLSYFFEASNKIFHCLMAGVPLAMSDHHEKRLIIEQFDVGVLFDETDPKQIANAVNAVLRDRAAYDRMRQNCLKAARQLNWEHEEHRLRTIFASLLGQRAQPIPPIELPDDEPIVPQKLNGVHVNGDAVAAIEILAPKSVFDEQSDLRALCGSPLDVLEEPPSSFPLGYYEEFLREIQRLDIQIITYADLFPPNSDDWEYRANYPRELAHWRSTVRDRNKKYLLIQHDVDNHPHFTQRMVAMEALYGVRSNIFLFNRRFSRRNPNPKYEVNHAFFQDARQRGFVIGYHHNAMQQAGFDVQRAQEIFKRDVRDLRARHEIRFMVPHGGFGSYVGGRLLHNTDMPLPVEFEQGSAGLRWVFNRYGPAFAMRWSDGGLRKVRDPKKLAQLDLIKFLHRIKPGTRAFCLVHPQRWGFNVDVQLNPMLAQQPWYQAVCARHGTRNGGGGGQVQSQAHNRAREQRHPVLDDPRAIEIITKAHQKNVASGRRSDRDFDRIFDDFFKTIDFRNRLILELGPGQFEFAKRVRDRGGLVHAVDRDPAVLELGRYLGFEVIEANLKRFNVESLRKRYDGLFCKFSINAIWFELDALRSHVRDLDSILKDDGWGWIAPWNGLGHRDRKHANIDEILKAQADAFAECGWRVFELQEEHARYYGIDGKVLNHAFFLKGLHMPTHGSGFKAKLALLGSNVSKRIFGSRKEVRI